MCELGEFDGPSYQHGWRRFGEPDNVGIFVSKRSYLQFNNLPQYLVQHLALCFLSGLFELSSCSHICWIFITPKSVDSLDRLGLHFDFMSIQVADGQYTRSTSFDMGPYTTCARNSNPPRPGQYTGTSIFMVTFPIYSSSSTNPD